MTSDNSVGAELRDAIPETVRGLLIQALDEASHMADYTADLAQSLRIAAEEWQELRDKALAYRLAKWLLEGDRAPTAER